MASSFSSTGPISRPTDDTKKRQSVRNIGGFGFDIRWGIFVPFDEELVASEAPHPEELVSNVRTSNLTNKRTA